MIYFSFLNLSLVKPEPPDMWGATLKKQYTRAIQKVTSSELLTIQTTRKKNYVQ
jgi:hypothetical protein